MTDNTNRVSIIDGYLVQKPQPYLVWEDSIPPPLALNS